METGYMVGLLPFSLWEHLCFSPVCHHRPSPPKERSEEEEVQPGWMGVAGVVGLCTGQERDSAEVPTIYHSAPTQGGQMEVQGVTLYSS